MANANTVDTIVEASLVRDRDYFRGLFPTSENRTVPIGARTGASTSFLIAGVQATLFALARTIAQLCARPDTSTRKLVLMSTPSIPFPHILRDFDFDFDFTVSYTPDLSVTRADWDATVLEVSTTVGNHIGRYVVFACEVLKGIINVNVLRRQLTQVEVQHLQQALDRSPAVIGAVVGDRTYEWHYEEFIGLYAESARAQHPEVADIITAASKIRSGDAVLQRMQTRGVALVLVQLPGHYVWCCAHKASHSRLCGSADFVLVVFNGGDHYAGNSILIDGKEHKPAAFRSCSESKLRELVDDALNGNDGDDAFLQTKLNSFNTALADFQYASGRGRHPWQRCLFVPQQRVGNCGIWNAQSALGYALNMDTTARAQLRSDQHRHLVSMVRQWGTLYRADSSPPSTFPPERETQLLQVFEDMRLMKTQTLGL